MVQIEVLDSADLDAPTREALRALWDRAFDGEFSDDDADHAYGGVHAVAFDAGRVVGHASAVPRRLRFADGPWRTVGYVEAVATDPDRQGEGIGRLVMQALQREIGARWPVAMLSTDRPAFYEQLGWERWRGLSFTHTAGGAVPDDEQDGLMVLRLDDGALPDVSVDVTCEDRPGDAW